MATLQSILLDPSRRKAVIADFVALVDSEVKSKGGLSGLAVKGAYAITKKTKPSIIGDVVDKLADNFAEKMDPFYQQSLQQGGAGGVVHYFSAQAAQVAEALLSITDARAQATSNSILRSAYDKLRPSGVKHVQAAVPGIAQIIEKHV